MVKVVVIADFGSGNQEDDFLHFYRVVDMFKSNRRSRFPKIGKTLLRREVVTRREVGYEVS